MNPKESKLLDANAGKQEEYNSLCDSSMRDEMANLEENILQIIQTDSPQKNLGRKDQ